MFEELKATAEENHKASETRSRTQLSLCALHSFRLSRSRSAEAGRPQAVNDNAGLQQPRAEAGEGGVREGGI